MATSRRLALAALSGALIVASMAPWALWPLAFVALVPLLLAVGWADRARAAVGLGLVCGVVTHVGGMAWALPAIARFQHVSLPAAVPFFVLLVLWQAVPFAVFAGGVGWVTGRGRRVRLDHGGSVGAPRGFPVGSGGPDGALTPALSFENGPGRLTALTLTLSHAEKTRGRGDAGVLQPTLDLGHWTLDGRVGEAVHFHRLRRPPGQGHSREGAGEGDGGRRSALALVAAPALWVVVEWAVPRIIPWHLGTALAASPLLRQSADLGGVYGLSFLVLLVNVLVASALAQRRARDAGIALLLVAATATYGAARRATVSRKTGSRVTVAVVQGALESGRENLEEANATAWST